MIFLDYIEFLLNDPRGHVVLDLFMLVAVLVGGTNAGLDNMSESSLFVALLALCMFWLWRDLGKVES